MIPPKISIVIPSFNKGRFIRQSLDSIFIQNYSNLEVIIQDGGSNDGSIEVIRKYAERYPGVIKWETKKDNGQLDAINKGLNKSSGEILTFLNADDTYAKGAFDLIAETYLNNPGLLWFAGRGVVIDENNRQIAKFVSWYKNILLGFNKYSFILLTNYFMQPSVFFTKAAYKKYGPFVGTKDFLMEYDFWLKLGKIQMPRVVNKTLSKFRLEPSTKTKQMSVDLLNEDMKILHKYTRNPATIFFHRLNNIGRLVVNKLV